ncbi:type I toxin-antitoxin system Fst family toxin [Staphylococcus succinus]
MLKTIVQITTKVISGCIIALFTH